MATTKFQGNSVNTVAEIPAVGSKAPDFALVSSDLPEGKLPDYAGKWGLLHIHPLLDTEVRAASEREFDQRGARLDDTGVHNVSMDLPLAQGRFCGAEGIENAHTASAFRSAFGQDYGVELADGPMTGLLTRTVIVVNPEGEVTYTQL